MTLSSGKFRGHYGIIGHAVASFVIVSLHLIWLQWSSLKDTLFDTDDAMRLVQVRALIAGRSWFDLHEPRLSPPDGYDTHWSRLVDAGLAGLYWLFYPLFGDEQAELYMRAFWPILCLAVAFTAYLVIVYRLAGRQGVKIAGLLAIVSTPIYAQFFPGRIDHHNVQIALTLSVIACAAWSDIKPKAALLAGLLTALALNVGLESLPFLSLVALWISARFVLDYTYRIQAFYFGVSLAIGLISIYAASIQPDLWLRSACDALSINYLVPASFGGLALSICATPLLSQSLNRRAVCLGITAVVAAALFLFLEPRCLAGPFAYVGPDAVAEWLSKVKESQPVLPLRNLTEAKFVYFVAPLAGSLACIALLLKKREVIANSSYILMLCIFILSVIMALTNIKVAIYALWFSLPLTVVAIGRVISTFNLNSSPFRILIVAAMSPLAFVVFGFLLVTWMKPFPEMDPAQARCDSNTNFQILSRLPRGVVLSEIDLGPAILALTPHSVVSAPYHRLSEKILKTIRIFKMPEDQARSVIANMGVTYIAACRRTIVPLGVQGGQVGKPALITRLNEHDPIAWLEKVSGPDDPILVYQVRSD